MCTAIALTVGGGRLFGRTLDWFEGFGERVVLTPRKFEEGRYAMLGMATVADGYPLYADGMNERGLAAAGLRFAGLARYAADGGDAAAEGDIPPWAMIPYLLGRCADVIEVRAALAGVRIVERSFYGCGGSIYPTAPLHWMVADADPAHTPLVIEAVAAGVRVYDAPAGVMANAPDYPTQMAGLRRFETEAARAAAGETARETAEASIGETAERESERPYASARATPVGVKVPGGYDSEARFVRAARLGAAMEAACRAEPEAGDAVRSPAVGRFFSLMGTVAPPLGAEVDAEGRSHRTLYTACMELWSGRYHCLREGETCVRSVGFEDVCVKVLTGAEVVRL